VSRSRQRLTVILRAELFEEGDGFLSPLRGVGEVGGAFAEGALEHVGVDDAGIEGDGGEAVGEFLGEGLGEAFDAPLGAAVGGDFGGGGAAPAGGEIDDDAGAAGDHGGQKLAEDQVDALEIDIDDLGKLIRLDLPERGVAVDDGGVVQQQVGRAGAGEDVAGEIGDFLFRADVGDDHPVLFPEFGGEDVDADGIRAATGDGPASCSEGSRHGESEAAGATGDENVLHDGEARSGRFENEGRISNRCEVAVGATPSTVGR